MKTATLAELAAAAEAGAIMVVETPANRVYWGDVIFWEGAWRQVHDWSTYRMKDNIQLKLTATGYDGVEFVKRFDVPKYQKVLKRVQLRKEG